jgi:GTPase SAR1 family protein
VDRQLLSISNILPPGNIASLQSVTMGDSVNNEAMQALGHPLRRLAGGIKKLEKLNISTTLSSLPKYAMVGDQSAGKSSIVQALCGIPLPRSEGTTTRCPFYITTTRTPPSTASWTCRISVELKFNYDDDSGTWPPNEKSEVVGFATVSDLSELELALRRAQIALLNPKDDPQQYLQIAPAEHSDSQVCFSPNLVCLDYQAPGISELAFYDLPGCINVYDMSKSGKATSKECKQEEKDLIEMIERTVKSYIEDEKCSILVACNSDQDVEVSLTLKHVRESEATERCIGVLTKADLAPPSKMKAIQEVLKGNKYPLGKGWYTVSQPSQQAADAGVDHATATKREKDVFATAPWSDMPELRARFGTSKLREEIAISLSKSIMSE